MRKALRLYEAITIVIDSREQYPYRFKHPTITGTLGTGDYSIMGFEDKIAIERKAVDDLIGCLVDPGRERFERELARSRALDYFALVIEASLSGLAKGQYISDMTPASVIQSILALSVRYRVPVWFCECREIGQRVTESLLEKYAYNLCRRFEQLQRMREETHAA